MKLTRVSISIAARALQSGETVYDHFDPAYACGLQVSRRPSMRWCRKCLLRHNYEQGFYLLR